MFAKVILCALVGVAVAQHRSPADDGDDGSYNAEKYEVPYLNEVSSPPQQGYRAPQQGYRAPQSAYRPATDSRNAAILSEQRYLSADGKFGAAYTQEDGVEFKEESDPDGTRRGSYSYVDPSGQRRTVSYTAGKHGFQATGDHIPVGPAAPAAPQPQYSAPQTQYRAPQQQYSQSQYSAPAQSQYSQSQYSAPSQSQYRSSQSQYSAPSQSQYRAPQQQYSQSQYRSSQSQYSAPSQSQYRPSQSQYSAPSQSADPGTTGVYTITANY